MADGGNIVKFQAGAPSARMKSLTDDLAKRRCCKHEHVEIWMNEPILECADCGGVVDPYTWIRNRVTDWKQMVNAVEWKVRETKEELEGLKAQVRILRAEYKDELEKARACRELFVRPPRRSF